MTRRSLWILAIVCLLATLGAAESRGEGPDLLGRDMGQIVEWLEGEFSNYNQVYFETNEFLGPPPPEADRHPWLYQRIHRLESTALGEHVLYLEMREEESTGPILRQRIYRFQTDPVAGVIRQEFFKIRESAMGEGELGGPEMAERLTPDDLEEYPAGCVVDWRRRGDQFEGRMERGACKVKSKRNGNTIVIEAENVLGAEVIWHSERGYDEAGNLLFSESAGVPIKMRRAREYSCWVALRKGVWQGEADTEAEWDFFPGLKVSDQGGRAYFTASDDKGKRYYLQLKETVFPAGTYANVFELFVHEDGQGEEKSALGYAWTAPQSERIGINLRWMQGSCSRPGG